MAGMISFDSAGCLHLLWLIPLLISIRIILRVKRAKAEKAMGLGSPEHYSFFRRLGLTEFLSSIFFLLGVTALILALAKPWGWKPKQRFTYPAQTEIIFALDVSNSMFARDVLPDRMSLGKKFAEKSVNRLSGEKVGLTLFAGNASTLLPLSDDYELFKQTMNGFLPDLVSRQGSALAEAVKVCAYQFKNSKADHKLICLITDGEDHLGGYASLADSLSKKGIQLFAVAVGSPSGAAIYLGPGGRGLPLKDAKGQTVISKLNELAIKRITGNKPGRNFLLDDLEGTVDAFSTALKSIQQSVKVDQKNHSVDPNAFLLFALVVLTLSLLLPMFKQNSPQNE